MKEFGINLILEELAIKLKEHVSLIKALTWRITASLDTFLLSYIITGRFDWATTIAFFEIITKAILYYLHERGWK
jgi:uncharacterized membrane protein